jgi:hypothetical protein
MHLKTRLKKLEQTTTNPAISTQYEEGCICFPANEPPAFHWIAEIETAAAVQCPLHGVRFCAIETPPYVHRAKWLRDPVPPTVNCPIHSPQYSKAWRASFPPDLWPAEVTWQFQSEPTAMLILRDGTEIPSGGEASDWQPHTLEAAR